MLIRPVFTGTVTLAGVLAFAGLFVPHSRATDFDSARVIGGEWQVVKDDEQAEPRDLTPAPKPGYGQVKRPSVTFRPSSAVVPVGGWINFEVGSSISGFGHIYVLSASGRVQVWVENMPIAAGRRSLFPTGAIGIRAAAPAGREDLLLIVTKNRIDGFLGSGITSMPRVLGHDHQAFKEALTAKFINLPRREWGYARTAVQVVDQAVRGPAWGWGTSDRWAGQWETEE